MLSIIIIYLFCALIAGVSAWFTWFSMGSPFGSVGAPKNSRVSTGYIFSFVGVWIIRKFNAREQAENDRLAVHSRAAGKLIDNYFFKQLDVRTKQDFYKVISHETHEKLRIHYNEELIKLKVETEQRRRANPWKATGACLPCFSWWFGAFCSGVFVAFNVINVNIFLPFFPIVVSVISALTMRQFNNE